MSYSADQTKSLDDKTTKSSVKKTEDLLIQLLRNNYSVNSSKKF